MSSGNAKYYAGATSTTVQTQTRLEPCSLLSTATQDFRL